MRIERLTLRLQGYDFTLKHVTSEENIADYSSRHPYRAKTDRLSPTESYINFVANYQCPKALTLDDIRHETKRDETLQQLATLIKTGHYGTSWKTFVQEFENCDIRTLKQFRHIKNEFSVSADNDLILRQNRIVLPTCYRRVAVKLAHMGHQGIEKTKALLRTKIYFVNMDNLVNDEIQHCIPCQAVSREKPPSCFKIMPIPERVWQCINVDYLGPWPDGSYMFVVMG